MARDQPPLKKFSVCVCKGRGAWPSGRPAVEPCIFAILGLLIMSGPCILRFNLRVGLYIVLSANQIYKPQLYSMIYTLANKLSHGKVTTLYFMLTAVVN